MATLLLTAEDFAYGPVGTLLSLVEPLKRNGHRLLFVGSGTAYELAYQDRFLDKVLKIDSDEAEVDSRAMSLFRDADALVSVLDRSSARLAQSLGLPVIWIDILFSWWSDFPDWLRRVDMYIKQVTLPGADRHAQRREKDIRNLREVGPIVRRRENRVTKRNQALVTFGGMEAAGWYIVGSDSLYPYTLATVLVAEVDWGRFDSVLVTGNRRITKDLDRLYGGEKFRFVCMEHLEYLKEVELSRVFLTVGGIQSTHEAFLLDTATVFLPPSNCTQYAHILDYRANGVALASVHLDDYFTPIQYKGRDEKSEVLPEIMDLLRRLASSSVILKDIGRRLSAYVNDDRLLTRQRAAQRAYLEGLPKDGAKETVALIEMFLREIVDGPR